jgi:hypothetical protein
MNARLGRMPWALGWLVLSTIACVALTAWIPLTARQCYAAQPDEGIAVWIRQLDGEHFASRELAAVHLAGVGEAAIEPLIDCIRGKRPEAAWRAAEVLTQIALRSNDHIYGNILTALSRPIDGPDHKLMALTNEVKTQRIAYRRTVALEKIRSHGGRFSSDLAQVPVELPAKPTDIPLPAPPPDLPAEDLTAQPEQTLVQQAPVLIADAYVSPLLDAEVATKECGESLTIDQNWRGGDAGLSPLCDLPELCVVSLNRAPLTDAALDTIAQLPAIQSLEIEDMSFSSAALKKFSQRQPRTRVVSRNAKAFEVRAERDASASQ